MATAAAYPKRDGFFAGKFCRLMTKAALANDIGSSAVCLLMVIAHQEDAAGYRGAVTYWNDQLKPLVGVRTDHALISTRKRAVDAGWLHYEPGGKGVAGRYWVLIPQRYRDLGAGPTAEMEGEYGPVSPSPNDIDREGIATGIGKGNVISPSPNDIDREGIATTILPLPLPEEKNPPTPPQAGGDSAATPPPARSPKKPPQRPEAVPLPAPLAGSPAFLPAWADWLADRKARGKPLTELAARQQLERLAPLGPISAAECVRDSIANGWTGVFPEKYQHRGRSPTGRAKSRGEIEDDYLFDQLHDLGGTDP